MSAVLTAQDTDSRKHAPGDHPYRAEVERRRTFAIISHPDAGKTTLTEKLLLYGGAVTLAGSVTARRSQRHAASDWMALEHERGISISSTVLAFPYAGRHVNLLDTPGHQDFSEDTYRTLTAVDSAVMVLDAARGIEPQTLKLFEVCKRRGIPIFTFINKLDRPGKHPLDLLDEIEKTLGLETYPLNWPIGDGPDFRGVYDRDRQGGASVRAHPPRRDPGPARQDRQPRRSGPRRGYRAGAERRRCATTLRSSTWRVRRSIRRRWRSVSRRRFASAAR